MPLATSKVKPQPNIYEFDALGTRWWCEALVGVVDDNLRQAIDAMVGQFVADYSRFDENALLNKLCRDGHLKNPPAEMVAMFNFARDMHGASDGIFNISVGGALERAGYGHGDGADIKQDFWDEVVISDDEIKVPRDVRLDFGGFGKGWLVDKLADLFRQHGLNEFIINGGGDLFVQSNQPIEMALEHPLDPGKKIGTTKILRGGLAVSSTIKRSWKQGKTTHHHIIDPAGNTSSQSGVASTYVKAPSTLVADTLATILVINPSLKQKLERQFDAQAIIVNFDQLN